MSRFRRYDYLLSVLPALEPIGSVPPMSKRDFLEQVIDSNGPVETVEMLLLCDDLTEYQALLAEEIDHGRADFAVLSIDKSENEAVLPAFLLPEEGTDEEADARASVDAIWSRYFHHAAAVAKRKGSGFLRDWIRFEVGLRNALVTKRARILGLDAEAYLVAPDLADRDIDYTHAISTWSAASDPLAAQEALDKIRWDWLDANGGWYSFKAREIEVYAAKLVLLHHWRRIMSEKHRNKTGSIQT